MKCLAQLLSLALLIGVATCMSIQEFEDDEAGMTNDVGWLHIHFHFHEMEAPPPKKSCTGNKCSLCKDIDFQVNIGKEADAAYKYNGCVEVTKRDKKFDVAVVLDKRVVYTNTYERLNDKNVLTCIHSRKFPQDAELCPVLYDVDLEKGKLCASMYENFRLKTTQLKHESHLGCLDFADELDMY